MVELSAFSSQPVAALIWMKKNPDRTCKISEISNLALLDLAEICVKY
jgi:hypothetical protein